MKLGYARGFADGWHTGARETAETYERQVQILREQLEDARAAVQGQSHRADVAVDQLLLRLGAQAISLAAVAEDDRKLAKITTTMQMLQDDPTADRPLGTPGSEFESFDAAALPIPKEEDA